MRSKDEFPIFIRKEDDSLCLQTSDQLLQRFFRFDDKICNYDKVKVCEEKFLFHDKDTEINTQFEDFPTEAWRIMSLDQEGEIVDEFLLYLQSDDFFPTISFDGVSFLHRDETKIPPDEDTFAKFLVEIEKYEADLQSNSGSTDMFQNSSLNEEEEVINKFLSSLNPGYFFNNISGTCLY